MSGSGDGQPDREPFGLQPAEFVEHAPIVKDAAFDRGRVDLIKPKSVTEQRPAFDDLPAQRLDRQVLHLVNRSIELPRPDIRVAPLGTDRQRIARRLSRAQPGSEKLLRQSVRTCCVNVANAGRVRRVEHVMTALLHDGDGPLVTVVLISPEIDVGRPAERGQTQPDCG